MRFHLLIAALLAAFLAAPLGAADRPVGPETGQARVAEADGPFGNGPDESDALLPYGVIWATGTSPNSQELGITATEWWNGFVRLFRCGITLCYR